MNFTIKSTPSVNFIQLNFTIEAFLTVHVLVSESMFNSAIEDVGVTFTQGAVSITKVLDEEGTVQFFNSTKDLLVVGQTATITINDTRFAPNFTTITVAAANNNVIIQLNPYLAIQLVVTDKTTSEPVQNLFISAFPVG